LKPYEVIIIGCGASGAASAFHLAKAGWQVSVVEKKSRNDFKRLCGGGMASSVQELFPFNLSPVIEEVINKVHFTWCLEDKVEANLPGKSPFWIVNREKLDNLILEMAIKEGAELHHDFDVVNIHKEDSLWHVISNKGNHLTSKIIVIANGSTSHWPRSFGLGPKNEHRALTTSVRLEGKGNLQKGTSRFEFGLVNNGFAWAFPMSNEVNVGIGTFIGNNQNNSEKILDQFLPSLGFSKNEGKRKNTFLRVWNGHYKLHDQGVVITGDAASLCDPFLAEGLRPALMSGCIAANCINQHLKGDTRDLSNYSKIIKLKWGDSMAWGNRIAQVFYRFPKIGYQLGIKRPTAPQRIAEILSGKLGYGDIANRSIRRLIFK
tara:strand:+ start:4237 stop:5364 length:1128 start_codon:yes stop_codon:yes gene_type:complete